MPTPKDNDNNESNEDRSQPEPDGKSELPKGKIPDFPTADPIGPGNEN